MQKDKFLQEGGIMFDLVSGFSQRLETLGVPAGFVGELIGVSSGQLSLYLSRRRPMPNEIAKLTDHTIKELEKLIHVCGPIPVSFSIKDAQRIRVLLDKLSDGEIEIRIRDLAAVAAEERSFLPEGIGVVKSEISLRASGGGAFSISIS
jgi:hypothetical protein